MLSDKNKEHIQAAVFRRLVEHLQKNTEIQNIDLMNLAGFCRNYFKVDSGGGKKN